MTIPNILLNDGHQLPMLGLGTYQIRGAQGVDQTCQRFTTATGHLIVRLITIMKVSWVKPFVKVVFLAASSS